MRLLTMWSNNGGNGIVLHLFSGTERSPTMSLMTSLKLQPVLRLVQPYTLSDPLRLTMLHGLAQEVCGEGLLGDVVECGVYKGGSAAMLGSAIRPYENCRMWLFDTFEGIPAPSPVDGPLAPTLAGQLIGTTESVQEVLGKVGFPLERASIIKGLFAETFRQSLPDKIALLHVDADWYDSVKLALETFYPRVVDSGVVILDDYGHWEGTRRAFYAFCRERQIEPLLERVGYTQAFWRKGWEHNRGIHERYIEGLYHPRMQ